MSRRDPSDDGLLILVLLLFGLTAVTIVAVVTLR